MPCDCPGHRAVPYTDGPLLGARGGSVGTEDRLEDIVGHAQVCPSCLRSGSHG